MDVYDIASSIGRDCQQIIEDHGVDTLHQLMPKIVAILEHLEAFRLKRDNDLKMILSLTAQIETMRTEKEIQIEERQSFDLLLEQMERSFHRESTELLSHVSILEEENKRLKNCINSDSPTEASKKLDQIEMMLLSEESEKPSASGVGAYLKAIVEGKRPPMISKSNEPTKRKGSFSSSSSSSLNGLLNEANERINLGNLESTPTK
ncbi:hypothetical protein Ciccas_010007 [Cichlidogyrus casuarinus]|uniref:RH1 domain-containing protein n=1 Tax=Cichlidogyrus casuarinus TaxID=1844966 RepID=A0ABD2PW43_9PLAT